MQSAQCCVTASRVPCSIAGRAAVPGLGGQGGQAAVAAAAAAAISTIWQRKVAYTAAASLWHASHT
jgi:hypothetical protein